MDEGGGEWGGVVGVAVAADPALDMATVDLSVGNGLILDLGGTAVAVNNAGQ